MSDSLKDLTDLVVQAILGVTDVVEEMHHAIATTGGLFNQVSSRMPGISGMIYQNVRDVSLMVGRGVNASLPMLDKLVSVLGKELVALPDGTAQSLKACLNGVLGHYLHQMQSALAIPMQIRCDGAKLDVQDLVSAARKANNQLIIMVHGSCLSDLQWRRQGHDHGQRLSQDLNAKTLYLNYNTGLHISSNGQAFSDQLERLVSALPQNISLKIVAHSMGGLVTRSACFYAESKQHLWLQRLSSVVFLGTPHVGAPLEQWGHWAEHLMQSNPYSAPLSKLTKIRSHGVTDLRYGLVRDEEWQGRDRFSHQSFVRCPTRLPNDVCFYAIAGSLRQESGDGLVPLNSAFGYCDRSGFDLNIPEQNRWVGSGLGHMDLLNDHRVYQKIKDWLA